MRSDDGPALVIPPDKRKEVRRLVRLLDELVNAKPKVIKRPADPWSQVKCPPLWWVD